MKRIKKVRYNVIARLKKALAYYGDNHIDLSEVLLKDSGKLEEMLKIYLKKYFGKQTVNFSSDYKTEGIQVHKGKVQKGKIYVDGELVTNKWNPSDWYIDDKTLLKSLEQLARKTFDVTKFGTADINDTGYGLEMEFEFNIEGDADYAYIYLATDSKRRTITVNYKISVSIDQTDYY